MNSEAVIIFVRHPELGKVKTRLARDVGDQTALAIYTDLLEHTREIVSGLNADRFLFYADQVHNGDGWPESGYHKLSQQGSSLGERMQKAFEVVFLKGYSRVVIIGSDCLELERQIIEQAFEKLGPNDVVLGPALDGGYYLLGMNRLIGAAFRDKAWSTGTVLENTLRDLKHAGFSVGLLPELSDIDTYSDLPPALKSVYNI